MAPKTIAQQRADQIAEQARSQDVEVSVNLDSYSLGEKIDLELALGEPLGELFPTGRTLPFRALAGLAWLTKRRGNPELTWPIFVASGDEHWHGVLPDPPAPGGSPGGEPERSPGSSDTTPGSA